MMWRKRQTIHTPEPRRQVNILGFLLLVEAVIMLWLGLYHFSLNQGPQLLAVLLSEQPVLNGHIFTFQDFILQITAYASQKHLLLALIESAALFLLTLLAFSGAIGFFRRWRFAWTQAIFIQGAALLIALILYFINRPKHIYLLFLYSIVMVVYLHYADVKAVFHHTEENISRVKNDV